MNKEQKQIKIDTAYLILEAYLKEKRRVGRGCTKYEVDARNIVCYDIFKKYASITKSVSVLMEKYNVHQSTAYRWLASAFKQLSADYKEITEDYKTIQIDRLEKLYDECVSNGNVKDALKVLEQINKLNGLYVDKVEIKEDNNQFTFGE